MTLNTIFSVVRMHTEDYDITWLKKMTILIKIYSIMQLQLVNHNNLTKHCLVPPTKLL
jgi:hypothetical protein